MRAHAAITLHRSRAEVERLWREHRPSYSEGADAAMSFAAAPGDRGTEIHVDLERDLAGGRLGEVIAKLAGVEPLTKVKDDRSDGTPEGELAERKAKQHPAQPLDEAELEEVGVR